MSTAHASVPPPASEIALVTSLYERLVGYLEAPVLPGVLLLFRRVFILKLFLWRVTELGSGMFVIGGLKQVIGEGAVLAAATWSATSARRSWPGTLVWLAWTSFRNILIFPRTFNLNYIDWIILFILTVFPHQEPESAEGATQSRFDWFRPLPSGPLRGGSEALAYRTIQVLLPIAFFHSVLSKLFNGYWVGGDYLAYATFYGPDATGLALTMRAFIGGLGNVFGGLGTLPWPRELAFGSHAVDMPLWTRLTLVGLSWIVLTAELTSPLLLLSKRTRTPGTILMMITQVTVAGFAGLYTWVFGGLICETLWLGRSAVKVYRGITYGMIVFSAASLLDRCNIVDIFPFWFF
jgi:hypothetical protein